MAQRLKIKEIMEDLLFNIKTALKNVPQPLRYVLSGVLGAIIGIALLASCTACGSLAYVRNDAESTTTITITNEPNTDVSVPVQP